MRATFEVLAAVARSELSVAQDLVGLVGRFKGELRIDSAGVEQQRCLNGAGVFLATCQSELYWARAYFLPRDPPGP